MFSTKDINTIRNNLSEYAIKEISSHFPIGDDEYELQLKSLEHPPVEIDPQKEKEAILKGNSLIRPLVGTIALYDKKSGKIIAMEKRRLLGVPHLTNRGTFIIGGVEYGFTNQHRLRPGVYSRVTPTGEIEAFVNSATGNSHRYVLDPESGKFYVTIGQAKIPLYPILEKLGIKSEDFVKAWGPEIYRKNTERVNTSAVRQFAEAFHVKDENIRDVLNNTILDKHITNITLKEPAERLTPELVLKITKKLLAVARNEEPSDDRDHIAFMKLIGPDDLFKESLTQVKPQLRKYFNNVRARRDLKYFPSWLYDSAVDKMFFGSGLGNVLQEINVLEILDTSEKVTRTGKGGIENPDAISLANRWLHPSHLNFIDPLFTPEGEKVGVDNRLSYNIFRDSKGNIYSKFLDAKTRKEVILKPSEVLNKVITFPGELESGRKYVRALINNQHVIVPPREVDLIVPDFSSMFSTLSNLIPMKANSYPQRVSMGARMLAQALPLENPEAPLVQNLNEHNQETFDNIIGRRFTVRSPAAGKIVRVDKNNIYLEIEGGERKKIPYYSSFPFNRKTFYNEVPVVKAGDVVKKGQLLAKSNYTDDNGTLALGKNLKIAYLAWEGYNYEDAVVVSQSAAEKLTSEHLYQNYIELDKSMELNKAKFFSLFPSKFKNKEDLSRYDERGIIKPGEILRKGDPIALIFSKTVGAKGIIKKFFRDDSEVWDHDDPGVVVDVEAGPKSINVLVRTLEPLKVGDKLSGRYGDKGIVSLILPDEQMPKDENGEPIEVILNPLSIIGRQNVSQLWELILGKIAKKTGQPYKLPENMNMVEFIKSELEKHGVKDKENIRLEKYNTTIQAPVGYRYLMKLHHSAETKLGGRSQGVYSSEETPQTGKEGGAKRIGLLEMLGILSHGAYNIARDARVVRGQKNEDFWTRVMLGYDAPQNVDIPMVYDKFMAQLIGAGIYPYDKNDKIHVFALLNSDIKKLVKNNYIHNSEAVKVENDEITPVKGGLFDVDLTGGLNGDFWSGLKLPIELPNPIIEPVIRSLLGLTQSEYYKILGGVKEIPNFGTGSEGLKKALKNIDIDKEIKLEEENIRTLTGAKLDASVKRLKYLRALKEHKVNTDDLFWDTVPILPPKYRPASVLQTGVPVVADINFLYKELFDLAETYKLLKEKNLDDPSDVLLLYRSLKAVVGLGEPTNPKYRNQRIRGLIPTIIGESPKEGVVQRKLLGANVDLVGRATIIPNPNLSIDEVGIPESAAWEVYQPYIVRRLIRGGKDRVKAVEDVLNKTEDARKALLEEVKHRPVIISRAPVLHKYGVMAAWPVLTKGNTIELHPFTTTGFGADFDGNCVTGDTKVRLTLNIEKLELTREGKEWLKKLTKLYSIRSNSIYEDITIKIEDFPTVGDSIKDRNNADVYQVPSGISTFSYDHSSGFVSWQNIAGFTVEENVECSEVITEFMSRRYKVKVSNNESLAVYNHEDGSLIKASPQKSLGKFVPLLFASSQTYKNEVIPISNEILDWIGLYCLRHHSLHYPNIKEARETGFINRLLIKKILETAKLEKPELINIDSLNQYLKILKNGLIQWARIVDVIDIGKHKVYDFIIPTTKVYAIANGLVVYDTMNFHVPSDPQAIKEAEKLLPSHNLISFRRFEAMYTPTMEYLAGLYHLSKLRGKGEPKVFKNEQEVLKALLERKISPDQKVVIM